MARAVGADEKAKAGASAPAAGERANAFDQGGVASTGELDLSQRGMGVDQIAAERAASADAKKEASAAAGRQADADRLQSQHDRSMFSDIATAVKSPLGASIRPRASEFLGELQELQKRKIQALEVSESAAAEAQEDIDAFMGEFRDWYNDDFNQSMVSAAKEDQDQ